MLKESVIKKLKAMGKEELLTLLLEICDANEDVIKYLNNTLCKSKIDSEKYINQIEKCFRGINFRVDKAINIYTTLRKTTKEYSALSEVGLTLLNELLLDYDMGNMTRSHIKRIEDISQMLCEDISKASNNEGYRRQYESLSIGDELVYDILSQVYYGYFEFYLDDEE
ncbi:MAG: hypothetical protein NC310_04705 [Roseburia sp.]|nr:hypothetical protein [Anaeroplasma bactoclasticum]MCM1196360.1 hypothetical protein [Roseburia sp.]MCM1557757.1 hypothetical protein [Anaeroplasma bactoclasticum]